MIDYVVLAVFLLVALIGLISLIFGLPGNLIILADSVLYGWYGNFTKITVSTIIILAALALLAEVIEFVMGIIGSKRYRSSNRAIVGSIVFGVFGAILGAPIFWGIGSLIGAFVGAFFGAFVVEVSYGKRLKEAIDSGWGALLGRVGGTIVKGIFSVAMIVVAVVSILGF